MNQHVFWVGLFILIFTCSGCKSWDTLHFKPVSQPVQFGSHQPKDNVDTLRAISGVFDYRFSEGASSKSENTEVIIAGGEYIEENFTDIAKLLNENPDYYIANGRVSANVQTGISLFTFIGSFIAGSITGESSRMGLTKYKTIYFDGLLYSQNKPEGEQ